MSAGRTWKEKHKRINVQSAAWPWHLYANVYVHVCTHMEFEFIWILVYFRKSQNNTIRKINVRKYCLVGCVMYNSTDNKQIISRKAF